MFQKLQIFSFFFLFSLSTIAQESIAGQWRGYNTQDATDAYSSKYDFELYLKQDGTQIWGRSYAYIDKLYAEMEIRGTWDGKQFRFEEIEVVNSKANEGMEWCIKEGHLLLKKEGDTIYLEGVWSGKTSFSKCTPGKVFLKKIEPRA